MIEKIIVSNKGNTILIKDLKDTNWHDFNKTYDSPTGYGFIIAIVDYSLGFSINYYTINEVHQRDADIIVEVHDEDLAKIREIRINGILNEE